MGPETEYQITTDLFSDDFLDVMADLKTLADTQASLLDPEALRELRDLLINLEEIHPTIEDGGSFSGYQIQPEQVLEKAKNFLKEHPIKS